MNGQNVVIDTNIEQIVAEHNIFNIGQWRHPDVIFACQKPTLFNADNLLIANVDTQCLTLPTVVNFSRLK